ncbi:MAG: hypothetical protein KIS78_02925 [Labilithrix sp.]|nr:hypothetical protein [Labilithrix sp.]
MSRVGTSNTQLRAAVREVLAEEQRKQAPPPAPPFPVPAPPSVSQPAVGSGPHALFGAHRRVVMVVGALGMVLIGLLSFMGLGTSPMRQKLGGTVPTFWDIPLMPFAPSERPAELWMSTPVRGEDGTVAGLVRASGAWAFVQLDEATSAERWRTPLPGFLSGFQRPLAWEDSGDSAYRSGERVPLVPVALEGGAHYVVAWEREFALLERSGGRLVRIGTFPEPVPAVSAHEGACFVEGKFWLGVTASRVDVGVWLHPTGRMDSTSSPRPAECPTRPRVRAGAGAGSPLQNARASRQSLPKFCRDGAACRSHSDDGLAEHQVLFESSDSGDLMIMRSGWRWLELRDLERHRRYPYVPPDSFELGGGWVFLNHVEQRKVEPAKPADAFQETSSLKGEEQTRSAITAIDRKGNLVWTQIVVHHRRVVPSETKAVTPEDLRMTMFASHPKSTHKNLYLLRPGLLLAVDQATGRPLWKLGGAGSWNGVRSKE